MWNLNRPTFRFNELDRIEPSEDPTQPSAPHTASSEWKCCHGSAVPILECADQVLPYLIIDDDRNVLGALSRELLREKHIGMEGVEVETCCWPTHALNRLARVDGDFDAAIVDYRMSAGWRLAEVPHPAHVQQVNPDSSARCASHPSTACVDRAASSSIGSSAATRDMGDAEGICLECSVSGFDLPFQRGDSASDGGPESVFLRSSSWQNTRCSSGRL